MITFGQTERFRKWLMALADTKARMRILARIRAAELGNFGDTAPVGNGVFKMRIHPGPGYRVYYTRTGDVVYLLLAGGDKASQTRDIAMAIRIAMDLKE